MGETELAKGRIREYLSSLVVSPVAEGFWSIYTTANDVCLRNGQRDQVVKTFQNMLTRIPEWSSLTLTTETERIVKVSKCTYIDDILMGVFISYMKSFASLHYHGNASHVKVEFNRPSLTQFIHELYKHSARKLWQVAYLFNVKSGSIEHAKNRQEVEVIINNCVEKVISEFLPWEAIAKNYFTEPVHPYAGAGAGAADTQIHTAREPRKVLFENLPDDDSDSDAESENSQSSRNQIQLSEEIVDFKVPSVEDASVATTLSEIKPAIDESLVLNL